MRTLGLSAEVGQEKQNQLAGGDLWFSVRRMELGGLLGGRVLIPVLPWPLLVSLQGCPC